MSHDPKREWAELKIIVYTLCGSNSMQTVRLNICISFLALSKMIYGPQLHGRGGSQTGQESGGSDYADL